MRNVRHDIDACRDRDFHPAYCAAVRSDLPRLQEPRLRHAYETTCPGCGVADRLEGVIAIGRVENATRVPLTREGYAVPDAKEGTFSLRMVQCTACEHAADPLSYLSPVDYAESMYGSLDRMPAVPA